MADTPTPTGKKSSPALFLGGIVVVLAVLGLALFMVKGGLKPTSVETVQEEQAGAPETAATETPATTEETASAPDATASIDVNAALSDRILGDTSAPVKISEHASFTCSHCGDFHRQTFETLKKEYIDTGKVYFVFSDFPLNAPAVHASMVARCLPEDKYFDFVHMLFETQEKWAYDSNYLDYLKTKAGENGLDEAHFQACIQNTELQNGIMNRMKGIQSQWNITSTPSFVINNRNTISGALPYEEFKKLIDDALNAHAAAASETPPVAPAPETSTEPETPAPSADDTSTAPAAGEPETQSTDPATTGSGESAAPATTP